MRQIKWAIIGAGNIAKQFAEQLEKQTHSTIVAVTARRQQSALSFAEQFHIKDVYQSTTQLLSESDAEVVYIATPHQLHFEQAKSCLEAGKAVLCEKPMTLNATQSQLLIKLAKQKNLFLMEAMITPLLPAIQALKTLIAEGELGEIRSIQSSLGFNAEQDMQSRIFNPELAGGALLDIGIYPLTFAQILMQTSPININSQVDKAVTGVDQQSVITMKYGSTLVSCNNSVVNTLPCFAVVYGSELIAELPNFMWGGNKIVLKNQRGEVHKTINFDCAENPYYLEAAHVNNCLRMALIESPLVPHQQTLQVLTTMDTLRAQWGLTYPSE